jgi:putative ABC transport system substrate-binding protein
VDDQEHKTRLAAFQQRLQQLGWTDGHNVRIDHRFAAANLENFHKYAAELVTLAPDVILAPGASLVHLLQATSTIPIAFPIAADPVGSGLIESLSRPGGNATGFLLFEYDLSAKWLELLKEIAPGVTRAAVLRDPTNHRNRPVRRHPVRGAVGRRGGEPAQRARRRRYRAHHHGIRAFSVSVTSR